MKRSVTARLRRAWSAWSRESQVLLGLSLSLVGVVLWNSFGILTPDTKPEIFLQPGQTADRFALSWLDTPNLGAPNYNVGVAPLAALFSLLDAVGIPAWLIMRLWRIGLLLLGAWGARLVVKDLVARSHTSRAAAVAGVAAAIAYAANPYVIVGGGTTPTLQPYALLPWLVLCWLRGFRAPSWRWAALAALTLAAMGGLNAGLAPALQLAVVVPVVAHALAVEGHSLRTVTSMIVRTAVLYVALSAHWLVPALVALGTGAAIAGVTESVAAINLANSYPEVMRGLGMWTLYGRDGSGPFDPGRQIYLTSVAVILFSFSGPILAGIGVRLSDAPARVFGATSVLVGTLVMVGSFPAEGQTLWGRGLNSVIEGVPGLVGFRTTNKAGAVLELGLAVLIGLAAAALVPHLRSVFRKGVALTLAGAAITASVAPALTGNLFWVTMNVPAYWNDAAAEVNSRGDESRVMMVPGVGVPSYTWGYFGPDEVGPSLFTRPFVFRSASPSGGEYAAALLGEVDRRLQLGTLPPGTVSAMADYLGVGDVVARHDTGADPRVGQRVEENLRDDRGLGPALTFGGERAEPDPASTDLDPVSVRAVVGVPDSPSVRVRSGAGALIVDGSGAALPSLASAGLVDARPALLLSGSLADDHLAQAIADGGRLVITDSNLRRTWSNTNPTGVGPVLRAGQDPGSSRALFAAEAQTTAQPRGSAVLTTRGQGLIFGPFAHGTPEAAFDDDLSTAWLFGTFGTGVGNAAVITPRVAMPMPRVTLTAAQNADSAISSVRVVATKGERTVTKDVELSPWSAFPTVVELGTGNVSRVEIEVTGVSGGGDRSVGFSEISIPGVEISRQLAVSTDLTRRAESAARAAGVPLSSVPLDVLLNRGQGDASGLAVEEARLDREFTLPDQRAMTASGTVRLAGSISDSTIDRLAGYGGSVVANSSSTLFGRPAFRASMAIDGTAAEPDDETAWVPGRSGVGEWISVDFPAQELASFTLTQDGAGGHVTRALVSVNDGEPFEAALDAGDNEIMLPEPEFAQRVRVLLTDRVGAGFLRITDLGLPRLAESSVPPRRCHVIGTLDGRPLSASFGEGLDELLAGGSVPFEACNLPATLRQGSHVLQGAPDFAIDTVHLADTVRARPSALAQRMDVLSHRPDAMLVSFPDGCRGCLVSSGQAYDSRWSAVVVGGHGLGPPLVVDGYAAGWRVDVGAGTQVELHFAPARVATLAWLLSAVVLVVVIVLAVGADGLRWARMRPLTQRTRHWWWT